MTKQTNQMSLKFDQTDHFRSFWEIIGPNTDLPWRPRLQQGPAPDIASFGATMAALAQGGGWARALQLLELMADAATAPNVVVYGAAVAACGAPHGWRVKAVRVNR